MNISLPSARDMDGNIYYNNYNIDLKTTGRELNFQTSYGVEYDNDFGMDFGFIYRTEPGNIKENPDEYLYMFKLNYKM